MVIPKPEELKDFSTFEDGTLLKLIAAYQPEAIEVLYKRYGESVFERAFKACGQSETAEKVTKDVFLHVWENAKQAIREKKTARDWLAEIGDSNLPGGSENPRTERDETQESNVTQPAELPGGLKSKLMHEVKKRKAALLGAKQNAASG